MLKLLKSFSLTLFIFSIIYLLASFYSLSFDISKWGENTRGIVSVMGGFFSLLFGLIYYASKSEFI
jgi:hypothetical protein